MALANRVGALLIFALALVLGTASLSFSLTSDFGPGPGFWPAWLSLAWLILACLWFIQSGRNPDDTPLFASLADAKRTGVVIGGFGMYLLVLDRLGFNISTVAFLMFILHVVERRKLLNSLVNTLIITAGLYLLFEPILKVGLPVGSLVNIP